MFRVDLRSDCVTHPSPEMHKAMAEAELGDDVFGDDPTTNRLQELAAERLGKEAALFVASGTMSNLVAVLSHAQRGNEIILGDQSHILHHEAGGASVLGGVSMYAVPNEADGTIRPENIEGAIRDREDVHQPRTRLLCLENTHNHRNGVPVTAEATKRMSDVARATGLRVHLDGARVFNAAVALECPVSALVADVDSAGFCLSKGLSCPVGSVLCGDSDFILEAKRWRKMVGGGMRQVGVIAAAGIVALETMVERLADDHANARKLAFGLAEIRGITLDPEAIRTNLVWFGVPEDKGQEIAAGLRDEGVNMLGVGGGSVLRMVTHYGIDGDDIDFALSATRRVMSTIA